MFISAIKLDILILNSVVIDSLLEAASSGYLWNCGFWNFHADFICHPWRFQFGNYVIVNTGNARAFAQFNYSSSV